MDLGHNTAITFIVYKIKMIIFDCVKDAHYILFIFDCVKDAHYILFIFDCVKDAHIWCAIS